MNPNIKEAGTAMTARSPISPLNKNQASSPLLTIKVSQETFRPDLNLSPAASALKREFPALALVESEEDEFDPNELKLLPVLATDRQTRKGDDTLLRR